MLKQFKYLVRKLHSNTHIHWNYSIFDYFPSFININNAIESVYCFENNQENKNLMQNREKEEGEK